MDLTNLVGKQVKVKYIPLPYLGEGIIKVAEVNGVLSLRAALGRTYAIIKDNRGNLIIERDVKDLQSVVEVIAEKGK